MIILDSLLWGGLRFVLDKIARAVDAELNDEERLREELLALQLRAELGEISPEALAAAERQLLARLRRLRRDRAPARGRTKVTGVEATTWDQE